MRGSRGCCAVGTVRGIPPAGRGGLNDRVGKAHIAAIARRWLALRDEIGDGGDVRLRLLRRLCRRGLRRRRLSRRSGSRRLDSFDRVDPIDGPIERRDATDLSSLGTGNQIGLREVESIGLVDLDGAKQQCRIDAHD